jgi:hypothetical protein
MTVQRQHRCGGTLAPRDVQVLDEREGMLLGYIVPGLVCDKCHEELIDRDTALKMQGSQTPTVSMPREAATTQLDARTFRLIAPAGTEGVAA